MKLLKHLTIAIALTVSAASFSPVFAAEAPGHAKVRTAVEGTIENIEQAIKFAEQGGSETAITDAIGQARQAQKEFRFELTERQRQKANEKLRVAREMFKKGDKAAGLAILKEALAEFSEMKATYLKGI